MNPMATWSLTDLPELNAWTNAEDTRTALLANQQDRNLFIQKAAALVERSLPMETTQLNTSPAWQQLKRKGYTNAMIAKAFAASWYDQDTQLHLPPAPKNLRKSLWMQHLPPVLITFFILIKSFYIWAALYPQTFQKLYVGLPAILFVLVIPLYLITRKLWLKLIIQRSKTNH